MLAVPFLTLLLSFASAAPVLDDHAVTVRSLPNGPVSPPANAPSTGPPPANAAPPSNGAPPSNATTTNPPANPPTNQANPPANGTSSGKYSVAYWSVWHGTGQGILPSAEHLKGLTHLILAFPDIKTWAGYQTSSNALFDASTPAALRTQSGNPNLKIMAAFGGWNLDGPFRPAVQTAETREAFANKMMTFVQQFNLDGIDLDWEYPVGNGAGYLLPASDPESRPKDESDTEKFVEFMKVLKGKLGTKPLSAAIPAKEGDMLAYTAKSIPEMEKSYDFINRRDTATGHHAGGVVIDKTVAAYQSRGMSLGKMVIGYPMYAKWFILEGSSCAAANPIGCKMPQYETSTGGDNGQSGAWMMNEALNDPKQSGMKPELVTKLTTSWAAALAAPNSNFADAQASAFYDATASVFWTWVSGDNVAQSCAKWKGKVGGFFAWSIDQDTNGATGGPRFTALQGCA